MITCEQNFMKLTSTFMLMFKLNYKSTNYAKEKLKLQKMTKQVRKKKERKKERKKVGHKKEKQSPYCQVK